MGQASMTNREHLELADEQDCRPVALVHPETPTIVREVLAAQFRLIEMERVKAMAWTTTVAAGLDWAALDAETEKMSADLHALARWSPGALLSINIANPDLFGRFRHGQKFIVDFSEAP